MEFIDIQRKLVTALLRLPVMADYAGRSSLLQGLPPAPLNRSAAIDRLDLNNIVSGLQQLGRLTEQGGTRPLIVVVDNALEYVPSGSEVAQELSEVKRLLAEYYGGDSQAPVEAVQQDLEALVFGRQRDNRLAYAFAEGAVRTARSVTRLERAADDQRLPAAGRRLWHGLVDRPGGRHDQSPCDRKPGSPRGERRRPLPTTSRRRHRGWRRGSTTTGKSAATPRNAAVRSCWPAIGSWTTRSSS